MGADDRPMMMIGLTVVSFGTGGPELAVGIDATLGDNSGLAVGNIAGTNLVNLLLILGLSAVLVPIALDRATLRFELPAMTAAALLLFLFPDGLLPNADCERMGRRFFEPAFTGGGPFALPP